MNAIRQSEEEFIRHLQEKKNQQESDFVTLLRYLLMRPPDPAQGESALKTKLTSQLGQEIDLSNAVDEAR